MKLLNGLLALALLLSASLAMAAKVTGSVLDVTDSMIIVKKGKQRLDIARDARTRVEGDLKKGARVTVEYSMTATRIAVKHGKSGAGGRSGTRILKQN